MGGKATKIPPNKTTHKTFQFNKAQIKYFIKMLVSLGHIHFF